MDSVRGVEMVLADLGDEVLEPRVGRMARAAGSHVGRDLAEVALRDGDDEHAEGRDDHRNQQHCDYSDARFVVEATSNSDHGPGTTRISIEVRNGCACEGRLRMRSTSSAKSTVRTERAVAVTASFTSLYVKMFVFRTPSSTLL